MSRRYELLDMLRMRRKCDYKVGLKHEVLVFGLVVSSKMFEDIAHQAVFSKCAKEFICRHCQLALKVRKPKDFSLCTSKRFADFRSLVLVKYVFKVNLLEVVGPRV